MNNFLHITLFVHILTVLHCSAMDEREVADYMDSQSQGWDEQNYNALCAPLHYSITKANDTMFLTHYVILHSMHEIKLKKDTHAILKKMAVQYKEVLQQQKQSHKSVLMPSDYHSKQGCFLVLGGLVTLTLGYTINIDKLLLSCSNTIIKNNFPVKALLSAAKHIMYPATFLSGYLCIEGLKKIRKGIFYSEDLDKKITSLATIENTLNNYTPSEFPDIDIASI